MQDAVRHSPSPKVMVWDLFIRVLHWALVVAFTVAYLVERPLIVHVWAGYAIAILVVARVIWGFVGSEHARFLDFVCRPAAATADFRDLLRGHAKRYLGHSPASGYMVIFLLGMLAATCIAGLVVYGGEEQAGPLAGMVSKATAEEFEEVHEVLANITLALVLIHIAAVLLVSHVHKENLPRAMVTGLKRR